MYLEVGRQVIPRKSCVHFLGREHLMLEAVRDARVKRVNEAVVWVRCRISKLQAACYVEELLH